jgi:Zn-dependent M28 family amino/carboxypeptidase
MRKFLILVVLAWPALAFAISSDTVDPSRISDSIRILASDDFEGRAPDSDGGRKAVDYIVDTFQRAGLAPGAGNGSWLQQAVFDRYTLTSPVTASVGNTAVHAKLEQGASVMIYPDAPGERVDIRGAQMVFVGYGITAPEYGWDDLKNFDLAGKVALVMIGTPDRLKSSDELGRLSDRVDNLMRRGAVAILFLYNPQDTGWPWQTAQSTFAMPQFNLSDNPLHLPQCEGWLYDATAAQIFRLGGLDLTAARAAAKSASFAPMPLDMTFSAAFAYRTERVTSPNVVGILRGRERPGEYVIYSAHWDHLGKDPHTGAIYSGALDDASGVAAIAEIARVMASGERPRRSVVFLATTMEEKGLLGARYYTQHPVYPLSKTVADLNIDVLMDTGPARDIAIEGSGRNDLDYYVSRVGRAENRVVFMDANPSQSGYYRADHYAFARAGVPSVILGSGSNLIEGGYRAGKRAGDEYAARRYHQAADKWSPQMNVTGMARDAAFYLDLGLLLANSDDWPDWRQGNPFRTVRDKMMSAK